MGWGLCLAALSSVAGTNEPPLLAPHSTVVLFCGIPGDAESESAYRDQFQNWLRILAGPQVAPAQCLAFCDQPALVQPPAGLKVNLFPADRQHFREATAALTNLAGSVVVIAWGHGGRQGSTPVLHIRGPRLTPEDLADLAGRIGKVPSQWVLLFRGSGAFGRALAGPGREILTSDFATPFSNDPMAMSLLLGLVKARPELPFASLADELGRATARWYAQRSLARTEDPAFWREGQEPRLLAETPVNAREEPPPQAKVQDAPATGAKGTVAVAGPSALREPGWDQVKRVRVQDYPGVDAVVLRSRQTCWLGNDPSVVKEKDEFIQILTPEGKRFGDLEIAFAPPHEEVELLACEIQRPDGRVIRLDPGTSEEGVNSAAGEYAAIHRRQFSLPGIGPGVVLHLHLRSVWKEFPMPRITLGIALAGELPVLDSTVEVRLPRDWPFHFEWEGMTAGDPGVSRTAYSTVYTWHPGAVPAELNEPLASPHRPAGLLLSTFPDWHSFADWYAHITQLTAEVTPPVSAKARELTQDARTEREKVKALYDYVTSLRYVAVPLGVNSVRPHAAEHVLRNRFGDCKDKANLLNALLRAVNIQADLVLVPRFGQADDNLPGWAFNHAISRVKLGEETLWLDTTDEGCRFGLLPPGDAGRKVLVADGRTASLTQLAMPEPSRHRLSLYANLSCPDSPAGWKIRLTATGSGFLDYQLRRLAQQAKERHQHLPLLAALYRPVGGTFALKQQSATAISDLDTDFVWRAEGSCPGLISDTAGRQALHSPFWLPKEWDVALQPRQGPLFLNEGYPLTLDEEFEVNLPPNSTTSTLPPACVNDQPPLRWRIEWTRAAQGKLAARFRAQLLNGSLSSKESALFQQQARRLLAALGTDVSFSAPTPSG